MENNGNPLKNEESLRIVRKAYEQLEKPTNSQESLRIVRKAYEQLEKPLGGHGGPRPPRGLGGILDYYYLLIYFAICRYISLYGAIRGHTGPYGAMLRFEVTAPRVWCQLESILEPRAQILQRYIPKYKYRYILYSPHSYIYIIFPPLLFHGPTPKFIILFSPHSYFMGPWAHGPHGPMGPWPHGPMAPWAHGLKIYQNIKQIIENVEK